MAGVVTSYEFEWDTKAHSGTFKLNVRDDYWAWQGRSVPPTQAKLTVSDAAEFGTILLMLSTEGPLSLIDGKLATQSIEVAGEQEPVAK